MKTIPKEITDQVGTEVILSGSIFSKKEISPTKFLVLGVRVSPFKIMNMETKVRCDAVEYLVKSGYSKARWTKPFPAEPIPS